jgi:pectate lyase
MISIVQLRKSFLISLALVFVGAMLALFLSFGTSAQNQTLFADDFEDGNANGWTKSGGSWSVVTADPRSYYNYAPDPAANVPSLVIQLAGVGKLGF